MESSSENSERLLDPETVRKEIEIYRDTVTIYSMMECLHLQRPEGGFVPPHRLRVQADDEFSSRLIKALKKAGYTIVEHTYPFMWIS